LLEVVIVALEAERYGLEIACVTEIQPLSTLAFVPGLPSIWIGLVNVRSQLVPLLDLRAFLGLTPFPLRGIRNTADASQGPNGQIVFVSAKGISVGLLVDNVIEVQLLPRSAIGPSLGNVASSDRQITQGLTPDLLTVLDLEALLSDPRLVVQDEAI
jgi:purine-binding chemotaxis protein CheW